MIIRLKLREEDERLLQSVAAHEGGHAVAALHAGLNPRAFVGGPRSGACRYDAGTGFQNSVVAWAGLVGEDLLRCRNPERTLPAVELTAGTFNGWLADMLYGGGLEQAKTYAAGDVEAVNRYPDRFEAARAAFTILATRRELLDWWTEKLANESREQFRRAQTRNDFEADERETLAAVGETRQQRDTK